MTDLAGRLLEAIDAAKCPDCDLCGAANRIVARYTEAVAWAEKAAPIGGLRSATAEVRVAVLAEVLGDLADAYGVHR